MARPPGDHDRAGGPARFRCDRGLPATTRRSMTATGTTATTVDDATAQRLAAALRCVTVSRDDADADEVEFDRLATLLDDEFPLVREHLELERFGHSRLYRWPGT